MNIEYQILNIKGLSTPRRNASAGDASLRFATAGEAVELPPCGSQVVSELEFKSLRDKPKTHVIDRRYEVQKVPIRLRWRKCGQLFFNKT